MNTKLIIAGSIYAVAKKSFQNEDTVYAQFLNKTDNGGVEIQQVKMTDMQDIISIKENANVKIPVKVSSFNNKMYFTQVEPMIKAEMPK